MNINNQYDSKLDINSDSVVEVATTPCEVYFSAELEELLVCHNPQEVDEEWRLLHSYAEFSGELEHVYFEILDIYQLYLIEKKNQNICQSELVINKVNNCLVNAQSILMKIAKFNLAKAKMEQKNSSTSTNGDSTNYYEKVQLFSNFLYEKHLLDEQFKKAISMLDQQRIEFKNDWTKAVMNDPSAVKFKDMLELMPVVIKDKTKGGNKIDNRFVYVRQEVIGKDKFERIKITELDQATGKSGSTKQGTNSFIIKDKYGNLNYQFGKLGSQIFNLKNLKPKIKDQSNVFSFSGSKKIEALVVSGNLFEWAKELEEIVQSHKQWDCASISADTQIMRYVTTASISGKYDPFKGNIRLSANIGGVFSAFNGQLEGKIYIPHYLGRSLAINLDNPDGSAGDDFAIGSIRLVIGSNLSCFVGASAYISGELSFSTGTDSDSHSKIVLSGNNSEKSKFESIGRLNKKMNDLEKGNGLNINANVFAGAGVDWGIVSGSLEWMKPIDYYFSPEFIRKYEQNYSIPAAMNDDTLSSGIKRRFESFAKFEANVSADAGIGAGFQLYCYADLKKMKFFIKVHAALCYGPGAKGAVLFYVDIGLFYSFSKWVLYQLLHANYAKLDHIDENAYSLLNRLTSMAYTIYDNISTEWSKQTNEHSKKLQNTFLKNIAVGDRKSAELQLKLAEKLLSSDKNQTILYSLPETKALFLAILTYKTTESLSYQNHMLGLYKKGDINKEADRLGKALPFHYQLRTAVMKILYSIQTKREWNRIMQLFSLDPDIANLIRAGKVEVSASDIVQHNKIIQDFITELSVYSQQPNSHSGVDKKFYDFADFRGTYRVLLSRIEDNEEPSILDLGDDFSLRTIYDSLIDKPTMGHCIVENNSAWYQWQKHQSE